MIIVLLTRAGAPSELNNSDQTEPSLAAIAVFGGFLFFMYFETPVLLKRGRLKGMQMASYNFKQNIPSCDVTVDLVRELEEYIVDKAQEISGEESDEICFDIKVYDKYGSETISSINDYGRDKFYSDVSKVEIHSCCRREFDLDIRMSKDEKYLNYMTIKINESNRPKEAAVAISKSILGIINESKNANYIFFGLHNYFMFFPASALLGVGVGSLSNNSYPISSTSFYSIFVFFIIALYFCLKAFVPYCDIDSEKSRRTRATINRSLKGFCGILITMLIAIYI